MDYLELIGAVIGFIYLYWEYKASPWLWVASVAMPALYLVVFYRAGLYADFGINVYYILASLYGLWCWKKPTSGSEDAVSRITRCPHVLYAVLATVFLVVFVVIGLILSRFTDSTVPWADAFTTALSIVAMWMLARKYLQQWLVWIVADIGCAALYAYKGLVFTSILYSTYAVVAVLGYLRWKRMIYEYDN